MKALFSNIKFETKKIYKRRFFLIIILLSLVISYNFVYLQENRVSKNLMSGFHNLNQYPNLLYDVNYSHEGMVYVFKGIEEREKEVSFRNIKDYSRVYDSAYNQNNLNTAPTSAYFTEYINYIIKYKVTIPEDALTDINYQFFATSYNFQRIQHSKSSSVIASKYISFMNLAIVYLLSMFAFSYLFACMRGLEMGLYWDFPIAVYADRLRYMTLSSYLLSM